MRALRRVLRVMAIALLMLVALGAAVYAVAASRIQPLPTHPFFRQGDPLLVIAHQGGDGERPGNTMIAFRHAADLGVDVLEMDIHSTKDGVLVVIHDATVDRTTNGSGRVLDLTFAEIQQLDAGYHWPTLAEEAARTDRPYRGQGVVIPALEEVLQAFPQMRMVIEIKQREPSIVAPFCALLRQYAMQDRVIVASFHAETMYEFRRECPGFATSAVEEEIRPFFFLNAVGLGRAVQPPAQAFQVPEYAAGLHVVNRGFIDGARYHNIAVQPWTINDEATMRRMIEMGVNGLITDYPSRLMRLLGRSSA